MPKSIPTLSQQNWGQPLNDHLSQLNDPTSGGINKFDTFSARPTNLTTNDAGKTYLYTQTGNIHQWDGSTWQILNKSVINVKDYGATGDKTTDDAPAIQAAVDYALSAVDAASPGYPIFEYKGIPVTVFFPYGNYLIKDDIKVNGTIALRGEVGGTYAVSRLMQDTVGKNIFTLAGDDDNTPSPTDGSNSTSIENLGFSLRPFANVAQVGAAAIKTLPGISSNSVYIRNCWFQTWSLSWNIWMTQGDDIQITNCTFDAGNKHIKLGDDAGGGVTNVVIANNDFYDGIEKSIVVTKAANLVISNNRFWITRKASTRLAIDLAFEAIDIHGVVISNNVFRSLEICVAMATGFTKNVVINGNTMEDITGIGISINGGGTISGLNIQANIISGNFPNGTYSGAIQGVGCNVVRSIITGNILNGDESGTNSLGVGLNLPAVGIAGNNFSRNIINGFATPYAINSPTSNGF
jgi:hypothetical protein